MSHAVEGRYVDYQFCRIFYSYPRGLELLHKKTPPVHVTEHAWIRFCQRVLNRNKKIDLIKGEAYFVRRLRESFEHTIHVEFIPTPEQAQKLAEEPLEAGVRFMYNRKNDFLFILHPEKPILITCYPPFSRKRKWLTQQKP